MPSRSGLYSYFLLLQPGGKAVSSSALDPSAQGYRLFTMDFPLGKTAPEKVSDLNITGTQTNQLLIRAGQPVFVNETPLVYSNYLGFLL